MIILYRRGFWLDILMNYFTLLGESYEDENIRFSCDGWISIY